MAASKTDATKDKTPRSYGSFFLEYSLMAEYNQLRKQNLPGVYIIPSSRTPLLWFGVIFVRQGLYQSGIFKFCVVIPSNYPDGDCPQIMFDHAPFHPLIDANTGKLDVQRAFPEWKRNVNHIWNVLLYTRRIFYKIETKNPLNPEAAILYEREMVAFKKGVTRSIEVNRNHLFDKPKTNDPYEIQFSTANDETYEQQKTSMIHSVKDNSILSDGGGLSWVAHGTTLPFSKNNQVV